MIKDVTNFNFPNQKPKYTKYLTKKSLKGKKTK